jgi:outer membrane protein OmpU
MFIINNNNNNKQRKTMKNLKKIGLTALAASLVSTSVFAGEMTVAGSAGINWENYGAGDLGKKDTTLGSDGTKSFSMGNQLTFSGSGELDNGLTVSLSFVLDQGDDSSAATTTVLAGAPFDSHSVTVSSDSFGSLTYNGEGGDSAQNAVGDTAAGNIWDLWDGRQGANSKLKESNGGTNFTYTLPSMVDGLAVSASYQPAGSNDESDTAYSLTYTGVEGLTVSYGSGSNDSASGSASNSDTTSIKASYAIGSFTVAYSDHEHDSSTNTADQDASAFKLSYTVSDAMSVSYAEETIKSGTASDQDAEYTRLSASYTTGGMTISGNMSEMKNGTYSTAVAGDEDYAGLSVSFAF